MTSHFFERIGRAVRRWQTFAAAVASVVVCEVGARVGLPGVDGRRVHDFLHSTRQGLISLYDLLAGGAVARAAILAVGALPYLQAKLYLWLARSAFPAVRHATAQWATRRSIVRFATAGLALVQSFGFARFLEGIPGAVADPGPGFVARTVLLVTGGAIVIGWLGEAITDPRLADAAVDDVHDDRSLVSLLEPGTPLHEAAVQEVDAKVSSS